MAVAHGGVGQQHLCLRAHPVGHGLRAFLFQQIAGAHGRFGVWNGCFRRAGDGCGLGAASGFGMPVYGDVGDIKQDFRRPVAAFLEGKQVRRGVDEFGGIGVIQKGRMLQQVDNKLDIRGDAADAELAQGAVHAGDGLFRGLGVGGDLDQKAVVIARNHAARVSGAAVQPDAIPGC